MLPPLCLFLPTYFAANNSLISLKGTCVKSREFFRAIALKPDFLAIAHGALKSKPCRDAILSTSLHHVGITNISPKLQHQNPESNKYCNLPLRCHSLNNDIQPPFLDNWD